MCRIPARTMNIPVLVAQYGYFAILFGTFLEGETVLLTAGFLAHQGYLRIEYVLLVALVGTICGDQFFYYLGRTHGATLLDRPKFRSVAQPVRDWLHRSGTPLVAGFRFLYGLRTAVPLVLGAGRYPYTRFAALNVLGATVWVLTIGMAGYLFGQALEAALANFKRYEYLVVLAFVAVGGGVAWFAHRKLRALRRGVPSGDPSRD